MIQANCRVQLTPQDLKVISKVVYKEILPRSEDMQWLHDGLDSQVLFQYITSKKKQYQLSLNLMFYVLVRHYLREHNIENEDVADYVASILVEFTKGTRAWQVGKHDDEVYEYLTDLMRDLNEDTTQRKFLVASHLGNYALWSSGLFGGRNIQYSDQCGRIGFKIAAVHPMAKKAGLNSIFESVSDIYEDIRLSLNDLSKETHLVT